jgi:hypothetical protein
MSAHACLLQVERFNFAKVENLKHLVSLITTCTDEFFIFDLADDDLIILDAKEAQSSTQAILKMHSIPQRMSEDLQTPAASTAVLPKAAAPTALPRKAAATELLPPPTRPAPPTAPAAPATPSPLAVQAALRLSGGT